ncbi:hypothetical protein MCHI_002768 [Candidatus Magnetoovum chiemensis]|nr:hypothetical protein MCHI_002768 [Candidatus Magnetoovum chiemensis]
MMIETQERISNIEAALEALAIAHKETEISLKELSEAQKETKASLKELSEAQKQTEVSLNRLHDEISEFKTEMRQSHEDFKAEMKQSREAFSAEMRKSSDDFRAEMRQSHEAFSAEMRQSHEAFSAEMRKSSDDFKAEMRKSSDDFRAEMRQEHKNMNKQWGALSDKMGTIVEDLLAPAVAPALKRYFNCKAKTIGQRMRKTVDDKEYEIDIIAVCEDKVFAVEEKATVRPNSIDEFIEKSKSFFTFFPEYNGMKLILIVGSLTFPEHLIKYATRNGIYAMAYREWDYVDILNFEEVQRLT